MALRLKKPKRLEHPKGPKGLKYFKDQKDSKDPKELWDDGEQEALVAFRG